MKMSQFLIASAVAAALAVPIVSQAGPAPKPKFQAEKCYGIAKAGNNDCQTANSSCAGTSRRDNQGDAWIYMPAGACDTVVGGSTQPKAGSVRGGPPRPPRHPSRIAQVIDRLGSFSVMEPAFRARPRRWRSGS